MAVDWDKYPTSGRTQWFAAVRALRPCGIGYGYSVVTTAATGVYAQFNVPWLLITTKSTDELNQQWNSATFPIQFTTNLSLHRIVDPITGNSDWFLLANHITPEGTIITLKIQPQVNLRIRFDTPPSENPFGDPIPELPNGWTITPLTREQVEG